MTPMEAGRLEDVIGWIGVALQMPAMTVWVVHVIRSGGSSKNVFPLPFIIAIPFCFMNGVLDMIQGKSAVMPVIWLGMNAYIVYRYFSDNDNDRWKRLKKRVGERIQAMNGRLVVVPVRS
jgi:hypothetical protein